MSGAAGDAQGRAACARRIRSCAWPNPDTLLPKNTDPMKGMVITGSSATARPPARSSSSASVARAAAGWTGPRSGWPAAADWKLSFHASTTGRAMVPGVVPWPRRARPRSWTARRSVYRSTPAAASTSSEGSTTTSTVLAGESAPRAAPRSATRNASSGARAASNPPAAAAMRAARSRLRTSRPSGA